VIRRGEICWASLPDPHGSKPGYRRPVLVLHSDAFNRSAIKTVIVAAITIEPASRRGARQYAVRERDSRLTRDSVINVSQLLALGRDLFAERVAKIPERLLDEVDAGLRRVLSLR